MDAVSAQVYSAMRFFKEATMSEAKKTETPDNDQGFNENELQDIMNEIESLEKEFTEESEVVEEIQAEAEEVTSDESAFDQDEMQSIVDEVEALEQASSAPQKVLPMKSSSAGSDMCFSGSGSLNFNMSFDLGSTPVEFSIDKDSGMTISMEHVEFCITEDSCVVKMLGGVTFNVPMSSNAGKKAA